jgi:hypothetical protein
LADIRRAISEHLVAANANRHALLAH